MQKITLTGRKLVAVGDASTCETISNSEDASLEDDCANTSAALSAFLRYSGVRVKFSISWWKTTQVEPLLGGTSQTLSLSVGRSQNALLVLWWSATVMPL